MHEGGFEGSGVEWFDQIVSDFKIREHVEGVVVVVEQAVKFEDLLRGFQVFNDGWALGDGNELFRDW